MIAIPDPPSRPLRFERSIEIDCPADALFAFHRDTRNAPKVSPGTRFLSVEGEFPLNAGDVFTIRFIQLPSPVPVTWQFVVESVEQDRAIVDVALKSPFPYWRHEHRFDPLSPTRTRLTDRVTYLPPLGPVGRIGARTVGQLMMNGLFAARQRATKRLMEQRG